MRQKVNALAPIPAQGHAARTANLEEALAGFSRQPYADHIFNLSGLLRSCGFGK
jgi:hypothetical protein